MKCFISRDGEVLGPYSEDEVREYASSSDLIWMAGVEADWLTKTEWLSEKTKLKEVSKTKTTTIEWYYAVQGKRFGPMRKTDLVKDLAKLSSIQDVKLWHKELEGWSDIFNFKDIVFAVGHDNRKNPRVPIDESLMLTAEDGEQGVQSIICKGTSISSEGIGVENLSMPIKRGQKVDLNLTFLQPDLRIRCSVLDANAEKKTANLGFSQLQQEAKSLVMDFIQRELEDSALDAA